MSHPGVVGISSEIAELEKTFQQMRQQQIREKEIRSSVARALDSGDAPEWCSAVALVIAAKLVSRGASGDEKAVVVREVADCFSGEPYGLPPVERNGVLGWWRDVLQQRLREVSAETLG